MSINSRKNPRLISAAVYVLVFAIVFAISMLLVSHIGLSINGGSSADTAVAVTSQEEIEITLLNTRDSKEYYFWDDGEKQVFELSSIFSLEATTAVPANTGIHKLVIVRDLFFFQITKNFYYKVE